MRFEQFEEAFSLCLDHQQKLAVQAVDGPVLLLAVPGSGKTTVLVTRLGYMLHVRKIPAERILTMTYTVAAARDMRLRFSSTFGEDMGANLEFRTINGVCSRIIRRYEQTLGRTAFRLLEDGGQKNALIGELYRELTREFATESTIKGLQTAVTYAKNQMLKGEELSKVEVEGVDFPAFYQAYATALRDRQLMDYDDQMVYALQILRQYPQILAQLQERYHYFCVDEAQDTSRIQHEIIRILAGKHQNLFMVGDEDQSIYGFRAAYPQALTRFDTVYPGAKVLYMEQNYRSTRQIVAAADQFIQRNRSRRPKQMRAARGDGPQLREISVYDRKGQYRYLCKVAEICREETAVLYRDNDSALPLMDLLDRTGIPYRCRQVDGVFFSNRVVRDITDIIRFARRPYDGELFMTLYYKLGAGISRSLAQEGAARGDREGGPILNYIAGLEEASPWTRKQCRALHTHMTNLLNERGDKAVYRIVNFMGYGDYLDQRGGDRSKADILEALGAQEESPERLLDRLDELRKLVQQGSTDPNCPFVLSTIHSSKGLEYDRVILMDVADGLLPKVTAGPNASQEERDAYEEERRLFYVGMTRAKRELSLLTFQRETLTSTFSRELFPKAEIKPQPKKKPLQLKTVDQKQVERSAQTYHPGARLVHKVFGPGILSSRTGDIATIEFDSGEIKRIVLTTALRAGQLRMDA